jgi:gliding motility-associated lipoprotein GldH
MLHQRSKLVVLFLIMIAFLYSCATDVVFTETKTFSENGWHKNDTAKYVVSITDTTQVLDIGFSFIHTNDYNYSNLWLFLTVLGPDEFSGRDTLELFIAQPDGRWYGKSSGGGYEVSALYKHGIKMSKPGKYEFSVIQGMRRDVLPDIESMEFWVQKVK